MVREALYFGLSRLSGDPVTESEWQSFVSDVLTPRFPSGFTVIDAAGQYREASGKIIREPTKVVVILHGGAQAPSAAEVAVAYRERFAQESVLRERGAVCVRF
jgi:hypothetical protein